MIDEVNKHVFAITKEYNSKKENFVPMYEENQHNKEIIKRIKETLKLSVCKKTKANKQTKKKTQVILANQRVCKNKTYE